MRKSDNRMCVWRGCSGLGLLLIASVMVAGEAGFVGPGEIAERRQLEQAEASKRVDGPPYSPDAWHKLDRDALSLDDAWGRRVKPHGFIRVPRGIAMLYNSKPPADRSGLPSGGARNQTGSLAFSANLVDWLDYPGNPVLYEVQEGMSSARAHLLATLYDPREERWVVYFGAYRDHPGQFLNTAYSRDLVNWTYVPHPTITPNDYADAVEASGRPRPTDEQVRSEGRVYADWAMYHEKRYYVMIMGGATDPSDRDGETDWDHLLLVADDPAGPFEYYKDFQGEFKPLTRPVHYKGTWYTVFPDYWDGKPGFGLAHSDSLTGPYEMNPQNPIVNVATITRAKPDLIRYNGTWAILYCHQHNTNNMPMRVVIAHIDPRAIPDWNADGKDY